jgi:hypothetical protein
MQHCKSIPTDSLERGKEAEKNVTTKKNSFEEEEGI